MVDYMRYYAYSALEMRHTVEILKAMGDPLRLRLLRLLRQREACVCELVEALAIPQYQASKHLRVLRDAGLVQDRRVGNWVHYSLASHARPFLSALFDALDTHLPDQDTVCERDDRRFREAGRKHAAEAECA